MTYESTDYSTAERRTEQGERLLSIYTNSTEGLITVSRIAAVLGGEESDQALLITAANAILNGQSPSEVSLEVLTLSQLIDKVESFCDKLGGIGVFGAVSANAPQELSQALEASNFYLGPVMDASEINGLGN